MIQVIVYSIATGRVRRVVDPEVNVPNVITFLNQVQINAGEARLVYNKSGSGLDNMHSWQALITSHTGLDPVSSSTDWYCGVDITGSIKSWCIADPTCGDTLAGLTLIKAPWGADNRWTYSGSTFIPPTPMTGSGKIN